MSDDLICQFVQTYSDVIPCNLVFGRICRYLQTIDRQTMIVSGDLGAWITKIPIPPFATRKFASRATIRFGVAYSAAVDGRQ